MRKKIRSRTKRLPSPANPIQLDIRLYYSLRKLE
jgi:hypothetical protein